MGVWIGEVVISGFDVEPGGPEVAVFDGDDEHEVVARGAAFDGVVLVVHDADKEIEGLLLVDGEVEVELGTHWGELHGCGFRGIWRVVDLDDTENWVWAQGGCIVGVGGGGGE